MCCFKRLVVKTKRKACCARRERAPQVTRPTQKEIDQSKLKNLPSWRKKMLRQSGEQKRDLERKNEFYRKKGWVTIKEAL